MDIIEKLQKDINFYKEAYRTAMDIVKVVQKENKELKSDMQYLLDIIESNLTI